MKSSRIAIGEAAARFGLDTHVLRHWEDVGLLRPVRDAAGRRRYADDDLVRIAVILRSKASGMSLDQIGVLLDERAPSRHRVLERHIADLEARMIEMRRSVEMTRHALDCRSHDITTCPRFRAIVGGVLDGTGRWRDESTEYSTGSVSELSRIDPSPHPHGVGLPAERDRLRSRAPSTR